MDDPDDRKDKTNGPCCRSIEISSPTSAVGYEGTWREDVGIHDPSKIEKDEVRVVDLRLPYCRCRVVMLREWSVFSSLYDVVDLLFEEKEKVRNVVHHFIDTGLPGK